MEGGFTGNVNKIDSSMTGISKFGKLCESSQYWSSRSSVVAFSREFKGGR